eukprot:764549-Hanusia_phi.AAC.7
MTQSRGSWKRWGGSARGSCSGCSTGRCFSGHGTGKGRGFSGHGRGRGRYFSGHGRGRGFIRVVIANRTSPGLVVTSTLSEAAGPRNLISAEHVRDMALFSICFAILWSS